MTTSCTTPIEEGDLSLRNLMLRALSGVEEVEVCPGSRFFCLQLEMLEARLAEVRSLGDAQISDLLDKQEVEEGVLREGYEIMLSRYQEVLEKLDRWSPPTSDHFAFRDSLRNQLLGSIEIYKDLLEGGPWSRPSVAEYRCEQEGRIQEEIEWIRLKISDAQASEAKNASWLKAFHDSLPEE